MNKIAVVVLAAGEGTRMKSDKPKVLHALAGKPLARWVLDAVKGLRPDKVCYIVGHRSDQVRSEFASDPVQFAEQARQLGSGHALIQAKKALGNFRGDLVVLCADTPLIRTSTLRELVRMHRRERNDATVLSGMFDNPFGYGRIVRSADGRLEGIIEEKDATDDQRRVREINSGIYCFKSPRVWNVLARIKPNNKKREYYLTDAILILNRDGGRTNAWSGVSQDEILGVNTRVELAKAEGLVRSAVVRRLMLEGVTVTDPSTTWVEDGIPVGRDTVILPGCIVRGATRIGANCSIGPYAVIDSCVIGDGCTVAQSTATAARLGSGVKIGPYAHLRPGTVLKDGSKVGNFSEVKKSVIGKGSKVNHLSYIGDATLGEKVNVGAGTITCNYDGVNKHHTRLGDRVFVGSNVNLVAPVTIGAGALLAAGSTITDNVPAAGIAFARARQVNKKRKK